MSANNSTGSFLGYGRLVMPLNVCFLIGFLGYLALFAQIFWAEGQPLYILIVATAALNAGAIVGFLYSTFGDEDKKFSQMFVAVNGVLGGATLTDLLQKKQSIVLKCLEHITVGCGLGQHYEGVVFVVVVTCMPVGFFWLYFNRKLILNPEIDQASRALQQANETLNKKPLEVITDPETEKPLADPEVKAAAKVITESKTPENCESTGALFNLGRSFYELKKYDEAIPAFQKALDIRPNQPEILLATASAMLADAKYLDAIEVLEKLVGLPTAPAKAWKLLGYAYLFYPEDRTDRRKKLETSIQASQKYIAFAPNDPGAKLNLICAYGQLGPEESDRVEKVVTLAKELIAYAPQYKQNIKDITKPGLDFGKWTGVQQFMELLG